MRLKRLLATALLVVCVLFNITTPLYANEISVDKDGTYTSAVFDTSQDAGKLTARYLHTTGSRKTTDDVTYAGDCTVFTSPEGLIMVIDCSNSWNFEEIDIQLQRMGVKKSIFSSCPIPMPTISAVLFSLLRNIRLAIYIRMRMNMNPQPIRTQWTKSGS